MAEGSAAQDPRGRAPLDCTTCGACCFSQRDDYIALFAIDEERMGEVELALTHVRDGRRFMRVEGGRCAALRRDGERLVCGIYAARPDACRWLERGSGECLTQIAEKSERALIMLRCG